MSAKERQKFQPGEFEFEEESDMTVTRMINKAISEVDAERDDEQNEIDIINTGNTAFVDRKKLMSLLKAIQKKIAKQAKTEEAVESYRREKSAFEKNGAGNPPAWVADEPKWDQAKDMARKAGADDQYAMTTWLYLNTLGGTKK